MSKANYITCASWEDRFIESIIQDYGSYKFDRIILFYFEDDKFLELSKNNYDTTQKFALKTGIELLTISLKFDGQIDIYNKVLESLSKIDDEKNYLNISTMPRHLIYMSMDILNKNNIIFDILYYIPKSYGEEIAKNPDIPQLLIKHSGIFEADKETLLIISAGLDKERIYQLYYYFEPSKIIIIQEEKNYSQISEDERVNFQKSLSEITNPELYIANSFYENGIFQFMEDELLEEIDKHNTILCSIGPKITSLEFYKFNLKYPKCGIVYALSREYSKDYSVGLDTENKFKRSSNFFNI